ncbi:MAG: hypothetical protein U5Q03_10680 [Bacteroidota bacterium]|nr:hypothetical protein [Bacteroidota bacterium]
MLIHDHLKHYVESSLDGYVTAYRYHGLKSWLNKLALWRPLIMADRILILPKDLSYSTGMKTIWDDGLDQMAMDLLCYFDQYACDMIESGYEQECIMEINEVSYLLAGLSVERGPDRRLVPFFGDEQKHELYKKVLNAFVEISSQKYQRGNRPGQSLSQQEALNVEILLDHSLNPDPGKVTDFCNQILHGLFSDVRLELSGLVEELRSDQNRKDSDKIEMEKLLFSKQARWENRIGKLSLESKTGRKIRMQFTVAFLQQISNQSGETSRITDRVVFETLNTIHEKMCADDRLGHYSFAIY